MYIDQFKGQALSKGNQDPASEYAVHQKGVASLLLEKEVLDVGEPAHVPIQALSMGTVQQVQRASAESRLISLTCELEHY